MGLVEVFPWGDYAFAATSIGLWVGSVVAMFLLIGYMRNM